ncbi:Peptide chain release factor 2 [Vibrio aerogenes CECT 7868]|uniref:Peptide chain release factor 2 n=1 Tax=Vibrio aerogenes CECT 7868 TaxID=1216006 RepID=A0A1M6APV4_9VIBR|nr:peptide chain release factor H [Vibrio aerogenes]SHI38516.1 Peptide chain release factor 2 [Vibrio aerogenes CECT 7868]
MILLQLSAGRGPLECCLAVGLALQQLEIQCHESGVRSQIIETEPAGKNGCFHSVLVELAGDNSPHIAKNWQGNMLWIAPSPFRPKHPRKNWFFSGQVFRPDEQQYRENEIRFQTCRASGAGGQHVNTTESAVRAIHIASGISVRVETERSQHANKRLAKLLLMQKLQVAEAQKIKQQYKARWQQHHALERGNPVRTFVGKDFRLKK